MSVQVHRLNYFNGLIMNQEEFREEQAYHIRMRRLHNAELHNPGILRGLDVSETDEPMQVQVSAGLALDLSFDPVFQEDHGREIYLAQSVDVTISGSVGDTVWLWVEYNEAEDASRPVQAGQNTRMLETAEIHQAVNARPSRPDEQLILARIVIQPGPAITSASIFYEDTDFTAIRKRSGFKTDALDAVSLTLRPANPVSTLTWAQMEGAVIDNDPGIVITSPRTNFEGRVDVSDRMHLHEELVVDENVTVAGELSVAQDAMVTGSLTVVGATAGRTPLGGVVGVFYYGANVPATSMDITPDGFMLADGGALPATTKLYAMAVAAGQPPVRPNLNNNTFLMGAATSGQTGGENSVTVAIPAHSHSVDNLTVTGSATVAINATSTGGVNADLGLAHTHSTSWHAGLDSFFAPPAAGFLERHPDPFNPQYTGGPDRFLNHTHSFSGTATLGSGLDVGGEIGPIGSQSGDGVMTSAIFDNRPQYLGTVYLIRVN